jgi:mRNA interferase MazF
MPLEKMTSMSKVPAPKRGEVWDVNFDPPQGAEIGKTRPAIVISEDAIGRLPLRIVVPVTDWKAGYGNYRWFVHLVPSLPSGLSKESGADAFQVKSLSEKRFVKRRGVLTAAQVDDIAAAVAICVGVP